MMPPFMGGPHKYDHIGMTAPPMTRGIDFNHNDAGMMMGMHGMHGGPMIALQ